MAIGIDVFRFSSKGIVAEIIEPWARLPNISLVAKYLGFASAV
jgi:hypothetical protein